jgi:hypothetical protein
MPLRAPFACLLGVLSALLLGVALYQHSHAAEAGNTLSLAEMSLIRALYADDARQEHELSQFDGVLIARCEKRQAIIDQLTAGRISLFEAAAEFKRLNAQPNPSQYRFFKELPGDSDDERTCWQVISWLDVNSRHLPPSQQQLLLDRVKAELREYKACNGTVILPGE